MATEWNGEGIPPVGTECEATWGPSEKWSQCVVLSESHVAVLDNRGWYIHTTTFAKFRPLQSEEQKQVAEIAEALKMNYYPSQLLLDTAQAIYNAGFRKVVE